MRPPPNRRRAFEAAVLRLAIALASLTLAPCGVLAQENSESALSTSFSLADWGLDGISGIRQAQLNVSHREDGNVLSVYFLTTRPADAPVRAFRSRITGTTDQMRRVSRFASGNQNELGGFFNSFADASSRADVSIGRAQDGASGLRIECLKGEKGYCGAWIHTFDFTKPPAERWYLDVSQFDQVAFWIRAVPDMGVNLKVADALWERREDSLPVGPVADFVAEGRLTGEWQLARVPLSQFPPRIDVGQLASIVFEQTTPGNGEFFVAELVFTESAEAAPPKPTGAAAAQGHRTLHKSTWVWNTAELIAEPTCRDSLIKFLVGEGFDQVYLQLVEGSEAVGPPGEIAFDESDFRSLIAAFSVAGIDVFALDGYARYALPEYHEGVLRTVDRVINYNKSAEENERFFGIRYDIEPYLLPGFHGPSQESIVGSFLDVVAEMSVRSRRAGLVFGVDIPFWYDARSRYLGEPITAVYGGERKPVSHHVIDLVDEIAIMAYRTSAYGADGVIRHSSDELAYATGVGKHVLVAVETHPLPDEVLIEVEGEPRPGLPDSLAGQAVVMYSEGDSVRTVFVDRASAAAGLVQAGADAESDAALWWPVKRRIPVPASKLTFADLGVDRLYTVMDQALQELATYPAFTGYAIHHAGSLADLHGSRREAPQPFSVSTHP